MVLAVVFGGWLVVQEAIHLLFIKYRSVEAGATTTHLQFFVLTGVECEAEY
jgi:hypothetical protein